MTSPPYADQRKNTYGGISTNKYVDWFLPISAELLRVLKPTGTFILNIKEKVQNGERSTYVLELILEMRKQGWLWTEEFIWHKKNCYPGKWHILQMFYIWLLSATISITMRHFRHLDKSGLSNYSHKKAMWF